ncbi:MAG: 50S ribosomal protein L23 [Myxococcota bacterium]
MRAEEIVVKPLFTEKGTRLKDTERKVIFEVALCANKAQIRGAVETLFNVKVDAVRTQVVRGKPKRLGRFLGKRPNWKKAVVTLREGHDIDFFTMT